MDADGWIARAVELATLGPAHGPNPRVGCVIVRDGAVLAEGYHRGAGTPHAEAAALENARERGVDVAGATAYVSLEPCAHTGRTPPCADALTDARVAAVVYAVEDPNPTASGGGQVLRDRGIPATLHPDAAARSVNRRWLMAVARSRPYVIAKWAATLDGRTAAADGSSFWITGEQARDHAHGVRATVDAIVVGTGTVAVDNPRLSARPGGSEGDYQPLRFVVGDRDTASAEVWRDDRAVRIRGHDPAAVLSAAWERECRVVLIEGGATLTTAFLAAGLVDEVHAYIAPAILGAGTAAVGDLGIGTMSQALRAWDVTRTSLGVDTLVTALLTEGP